ncbi:hypothetical protein IW143_004554, partial [Coemansia sp. RSA 520]
MLALRAVSATGSRSRLYAKLRSPRLDRFISTALLDRRLALWNSEKERQGTYAVEHASERTDSALINVSILGKEQSAMANVSRPLDLARKYDQKNAKKYIAALVNDTMVWDMQRPLPESAVSLKFLQFDVEDDPVAKEVFWHSSAHVMGAALEQIYGDDLMLCDGPALPEGGFFYEFLLLNPEQRVAVDRLDRYTPYTDRINQLCGVGAPPGSIRFLTAADLS